MNDAFRITVHWAERVIELRCPRAPTVLSFERASDEIRAAVARMTGPWRVLVDDREVEELPDAVLDAIRDIILWSMTHGMENSARVTRLGSEFDKAMRRLGPDTDLPRAGGLPCSTREEAWELLVGAKPRTTPGEVKALQARVVGR